MVGVVTVVRAVLWVGGVGSGGWEGVREMGGWSFTSGLAQALADTLSRSRTRDDQLQGVYFDDEHTPRSPCPLCTVSP